MAGNPEISAPGVTIHEANGFTYIDVMNSRAEARLCNHGAHVLSFTPTGQQPVLWLSKHALFRHDKAIRGGIPICWPWFGSHPSDSSLPSHGFARVSEWKLVSISGTEDVTEVTFELCDSDDTRTLWNWRFRLSLSVRISSTLTISLTTENLDDKRMAITQALHSYFSIGDISSISVTGLESTDYLDQVGQTQRRSQEGKIVFQGEVDRDYLDTQSTCVIHDPKLERKITIAKTGSNSTVVWNPWIEKSVRMSDFGDSEYLEMVCVETTNATEFDTVSIEPGRTHTVSATLSSSEISRA